MLLVSAKLSFFTLSSLLLTAADSLTTGLTIPHNLALVIGTFGLRIDIFGTFRLKTDTFGTFGLTTDIF